MKKVISSILFLSFFVIPVLRAEEQKEVSLTLAVFTTPREVFEEKLIPGFQELWKQKRGQHVTLRGSYLGSGAQSRAVVTGFEADIAFLSLEEDIQRIQKAGLITHNWKDLPKGGFIAQSIVVLGTRPGNPLGIKDWKDLVRDDVEILMPNPKTSGGAMWNVLAIYGAARRGKVPGYEASDAGARKFLRDVLKRVTVLDKGARESIINFEKGIGNVIIAYENEILIGQKAGQKYDYVIPSSTILIEMPCAAIDVNAGKHGVRTVVDEFYHYLVSYEAQKAFAEYGFRPVHKIMIEQEKLSFAPVQDLWTIQEFGGWDKTIPEFFGADGIFTQVMEEVQREK